MGSMLVSSPNRFVRKALPLFALALLVAWSCTASAGQEPDAFTRALEKGPLYAAMAAYLGGLLTSLTPCVYPMIAITVSVFGAKEARSRREAMLLSSAFVAGIVVLFTTMLVAVALAGGVFGTILANQWVTLGIAVVFVALALSMFGAFEMVLPDSLMQRLSSVGGIGYPGAFVLGLVSGVVAAPCTGPVLTGILLWIGRTQNVALGAAVGSAFSLGLGTLFWLVGTFAVALPKGGKWMLGIKSFFGIVMLVVALYFAKASLPFLAAPAQHTQGFLVAMAILAFLGIASGAVHLDFHDAGLATRARKTVAIAATVFGAFMFVAALEKTQTALAGGPSLQWLTSEAEATARARAEHRPLLIDFTADWCKACKELAVETFAAPEVAARLSSFVTVKVDATNDEDKAVESLKEKYSVVGLPTVIVLDADGKERARINEFTPPAEFMKRIAGVH